MKKSYKFLISLLMLMPLTSCDISMVDTVKIPEGGYDGSNVTVKFYHTMGSNLSSILDKYIPEFNKLFPNITVKHGSVGGYDDIRDYIKYEIARNEQPSMAYATPDHVALYNRAKAAVPLDTFIDDQTVYHGVDANGNSFDYTLGLSEAEKNDFIDGFYKVGSDYGNGLQYSLPFSKSTEVLYYNEDFFVEHDLIVPTTWDEMWDVCAQIKKIDPNCTPLGYDSASNWFITMCEQMGSGYTSSIGDHFLFDNKQNRDFLTSLTDKFQKGYFVTADILSTYTSSIFTSIEPGYGKAYMSIGSSAGANHQRPRQLDNGKYAFNVGISPIPQVDKANPKVISQGPELVLLKQDDPKTTCATWLFVKYLLTNKEFQSEFSLKSGYMPVLKSVANDPNYETFLNTADGGEHIAALSARVAFKQEESYFSTPAFIGSDAARDEVGKIVNDVITLARTQNDAFKMAMETCEYQINNTKTPYYGLKLAVDYLYQLYKNLNPNQPMETLRSYDVIKSLLIDREEYKIDWSVVTNSSEANSIVSLGESTQNTQTINVVNDPLINFKDTPYKLIAKITDSEGNSVTQSFDRVVPKCTIISIGEFIKNKNNKDVQYIKGTVVAANGSHEVNGSFVISDGENTIFSYNKFNVAVGDEVLLATKHALYNGLPQSDTIKVSKILSTGNDCSSFYNLATEYTAASLKAELAKYRDNYEMYEAIGQKCLKVTGIATVSSSGYVALRVNADDTDFVIDVYSPKSLTANITNGQQVTIIGYVRGLNASGDNIVMQLSKVL